MNTIGFWRNRLFFFGTIWSFTMAVASFIIIVSTGGVNQLYWDTIGNIAIRGVGNFGCYIIIFSIVIEQLSRYFPYSGRYIFWRLLISVVIGLGVAYVSANITEEHTSDSMHLYKYRKTSDDIKSGVGGG
ncbi:MAG: hypothetical protein AAGJ93_13980, partial [Bacteroidota bacterium]